MLEENTGTQTRVRLPAERKSTFRRRFGPDIAVSAISAFSLKARTPRYRSRLIARNWTLNADWIPPHSFRRISRSDFTGESRYFVAFHRSNAVLSREEYGLLLDFREIPWCTQTCVIVVNVRVGETLLLPFDNICYYTSKQHIDVNFARRIIIRIL